jgi:hypothetical protein
MKCKTWIAISLKDFHDPSKKWQSGTVDSVKVCLICAKTLEDAKDTARIDNNDAWMVFDIGKTANIAYVKGGN